MPSITLGDTRGMEWVGAGWGDDELIWEHVSSEVHQVEMSRI